MKILYLDESGDHDLITIDPGYSCFVLAGCIIDSAYHDNILLNSLDSLKRTCFGTTNIILHYADYTRNKNGFEDIKDKNVRELFYNKLNELVKSTDFVLLGCVIDKKKHAEHYKYPSNPYIYSLEVILEKYIMYLNENKEKGTVIAESRGPQNDNELNLAFLDLKIRGTRFLTPTQIVNTIGSNFYFKKKEENIAGLQLVDSLATPIGRRYLSLKNHYINYNVIKGKFRKHRCGKYRGYGLVILPK